MKRTSLKTTIKNLFIIALALVITISAVPVTNVQAATKKITITNVKGSTKTLTKGKKFTLKTNYSASKLKFKSSNTKVATVDSKGKITAKKKGTAKVTITLKSNTKVKKTLTIKVKNPAKPIKYKDSNDEMEKSDFDISSFSDGGIILNEKIYTNYLDCRQEFECVWVDYGQDSCADPKNFVTSRGIKMGDNKQAVFDKYPESCREQAYKTESFRKAHMEMLERCFSNNEHKATEYTSYRLYYNNKWSSIEFVFDQNDKVMTIIYW